MDMIASQLTVSYIVVRVLELLKNAPWFPVLTQETSNRIKKAVGVIVAGSSALGITYHYDPSGMLTISGLTVSSIVGFAWTWIQNYVAQQVLYHGVVKNGSPTSNPPPHS